MKINAISQNAYRYAFKDNIGKNLNPQKPQESKVITIIDENKQRPVINKTTQILFSQDGSAISSTKEDIIYDSMIYNQLPAKAYMPPKPKEAYIYSLLNNSQNIVSTVIFANDADKKTMQTTIKTARNNTVKVTTYDYKTAKLIRETVIKDLNSTDEEIKQQTQKILNEYGLKNITQFGVSTVQ